MGGIAGGIRGQAPPFQPVGGVGAHAGIYAGEHRHPQKHAQHAAYTAPHQDSHDDPEAGQAGAVPQDLGAKDIAVKLLERKDKEDEVQALDGAVQQDEKGAGDGPQEGPEEGDHIGDAHHQAHQGA